MALRIGELLVKSKLITQDQLDEALKAQKEKGGKLGEALTGLGFVTEQDITEVLSQQFGVPAIDLEHFEIDENVAKIIPPDISRKYQVMPVSRTGATLTVAMADPTNVFAIDDIKFLTGYNVEPVIASETAIQAAIDNYYGTSHAVELKKVMDDIASSDDAALEVLEEDEEPCGCVAMESAKPGVVYLERLAVLPKARRRGLGEALVRHVLKEAKKIGAYRVEIGLIAEHEELRRWYKKLGFIYKKTVKYDHLPFEAAFMVKKV